MRKYRFTYKSKRKERVIFTLIGEGFIKGASQGVRDLFFFLTVGDDVAESLKRV